MKSALKTVACLYLLAVSTSHAPGQALAQCPGGSCPTSGPSSDGYPLQYAPQPQYAHQPPYQPPAAPAPQPPVMVPRSVYYSIVKIENWLRDDFHADASGSLVAKGNGRGLILTCAHTFTDNAVGRIVVTFQAGTRYEARLLEADPVLDLAMLEIVEPAEAPILLAQRDPSVGELVRSLGYGSSNGKLQCNTGQAVGYFTRQGAPPDSQLTISGPATFGDSGGPMLDQHWKVCAVIYGTNGRVCDGTRLPRLRAFMERWRARCEFRRQHAPIFNRPPARPPQVNYPAQNIPNNIPARRDPQLEAPKLDEGWRPPIVEAGQQATPPAAAQPPAAQPPVSQVPDRPAQPPPEIEIRNPFGTPPFGRLEGAARQAGTSLLTKALVGLGVASPIAGIAAGLAMWVVSRRAKKRIVQLERRLGLRPPELVTRTIHEPAPAAAMAIDERHHTQIVEVPDNIKDRAWARALQTLAEKYPGQVNTLVALERLKNQILKGEPANPGEE